MTQWIKDQLAYGLRYVPLSLLKYPFLPKESDETRRMRSRGFLCGVCHPSDNVQQIQQANIRWVRYDIPYPFEKDGSLTAGYLAFKDRSKRFQASGIRVMAITPYPHSFFDAGIDVRTPAGEAQLQQVARFLVTDLQGAVSGLQVTNEMGIPHFTLPLHMSQAARFIGLQLQAMQPLKGDILLGYNSAIVQADLHGRMLPYLQYCDYVGMDIYMGCFMNMPGYLWVFDAVLNYLWAMTRKPVILMEFGYISAGKPKTPAEKQALLQQYGAKDEADAKKNIRRFVQKLPQFMQDYVKLVCHGDESRYYDLLFRSDYTNHLYKELPRATKIPGYEHTYPDQARFYRDLLPRIYSKPFMVGAFVYAYRDADRCHVCGQDDCPTETKWGLTERNGTPKPSYYAVRDAYAKIQQK